MNDLKITRWFLPAISAAIVLCASSGTLLADVVYTSQVRTVAASASRGGGGDSRTAFGFGEFNESLNVSNPTWGNFAGASQRSTLSATRMDAEGGSSAYGGIQYASGHGESSFDVSFTVETPTPYTLYGYWQAHPGWGFLADTGIEFTGPGGTIYSSRSAIYPIEKLVDNYYFSGTLEPGSYRLKTYGVADGSGTAHGTDGSFAVTLLAPVPSTNTCAGTWLWGDPLSETNGAISALTRWDADGGGPLPAVLVAGGTFTMAGDSPASNIAAWNEQTQQWLQLGAGTNGRVAALLALPNGDLIAGGDFTVAGGVAASHVAKWNGMSWTALGAGTDGPVFALAVLPSGEVIAGGSFSTAGQVHATKVARWNGTAWTAMGPDQLNGAVNALAVRSDGQIFVGGEFYFIDENENASIGIATWDGTAWIGIGDYTSFVTFALLVMPNGDLISGDWNGYVRRWNGSSWSTIEGNSGNATVNTLALSPTGDIIAAGNYNLSPPCCDIFPIFRWDGTRWSLLGSGMNASVQALAFLSTGELVAGGQFTSANNTSGSVGVQYLARWDGAAWTALASPTGVDGMVNAIAVMSQGPAVESTIVAGGRFNISGTLSAQNIVIRNGTESAALGAGINGEVYSLVVMPNGDLIAGGSFSMAGTTPARSIAKWDGTGWQALGTGMNGGVSALALMPNGDLIAGGYFSTAGDVAIGYGIARWDGTQWSALGSAMNSGGYVRAVTVLPNGDVVAGGSFTTAGGVAIGYGIARWNGSEWSSLGTGMNNYGDVYALAVLPNGDVIAGGSFYTAGGVSAKSIARWDGAVWAPVGAGIGPGSDRTVLSLAVRPQGDVLAGGRFYSAGNIGARFLARWNGNAWSAVTPPINGEVRAIATLSPGDLAVGGSFTAAGNAKFENIARYSFGNTSPPIILEQPFESSTCRGGQASFFTRAQGTGTLNFAWQVEVAPPGSENWIGLTDGSMPSATSSGAMLSGTATDTLMMSSVDLPAALRYRAVVSEGCDNVPTDAAALLVCPGDFDCDGGVDGADVSAFFQAWEAGQINGDVNADGGVDGSDVSTFFQHWEAGC